MAALSQVTSVQNTQEKKSGKRLREELNESTDQQTTKRKRSSTSKKGEHVTRTAEVASDTHVTATPGEGNGSLKEDVEDWKVAPQKR